MVTAKNMLQKGFSLVEMVIALAIFLLVVITAVTIFTSLIQQQKRILTEQHLLGQISYLQEYFSRGLMMAGKATDTSCLSAVGRIYELTHCPADTSQPCNGVKFINQLENHDCEEFYMDTTDPQNPILIFQVNGGQAFALGGLKAVSAKFVINGDKTRRFSPFGDGLQPRVTMLLDIKSDISDQEKVIQTTVSQRDLDVSF